MPDQTQLNQHAIEAAASATDPGLYGDFEADLVKHAGFSEEKAREYVVAKKRRTEDFAREAVSAYLAVAQPVVNSVEELHELPVNSVALDRFDYPHHKYAQSKPDFKNLSTGHHISRSEFCLPTRVLYRPEVKP